MNKKLLNYFNGDDLAGSTWKQKYAWDGEVTPDDMHLRLAQAFLDASEKRLSKYPTDYHEGLSDYGRSREPLTLDTIYAMFRGFKFVIPQGSVMQSAGTTLVSSLSNCMVVPPVVDSYGGIFKTDEELAQLMKNRCGVGVDISGLRPEGTPTNNVAKTSTGAHSFMNRFSNTTREVAQGGRRGALMLSIDIRHPDALEFIKKKRDLNKVTGANVSVKITDEFMRAVTNPDGDDLFTQQWPVDSVNPEVVVHTGARKIWDELVESNWLSAEPGILFWDRMEFDSPDSAYDQYKPTSTNPCFAKDTLIVTDDGLKRIDSLVGKTVNILSNGEWVSINNFRITGEDQDMLKITIQDGSSMRVTPYHNLILDDGTRVEAKDLIVGDSLLLSEYETSGSISEKGAYLKGFLAGDGTSENNDRPLLYLYSTKYACEDRLISSAKEIEPTNFYRNTITDVYFNEENKNRKTMTGLSARKDDLFPWVRNNKYRIPEECFSWDLHSKCEFIAGLLDADGSAQDSSNGFMYQIWSIHKDFLLDLQTLLKTIGVRSKISLGKSAGKKDFNDGYGEYESKDCYRLTISQIGSVKLSSQVNFERLVSFSNKIVTYNLKPRMGKIVSIIEDGVDDEVFCCTVPNTHSLSIGLGVESAQCGEVPLDPYNSCRLIALNLLSFVDDPYTVNSYFDFELFHKVVYEAMILSDLLVDMEAEAVGKIIDKIEKDKEPDEIKVRELEMWKKVKKAGEDSRRTGLGITGLGDALAAMGLDYNSEEALAAAGLIFEKKMRSELECSIDLANLYGPFKGFDPEVEAVMPFYKSLADSFPDLMEKMFKYGRRNVSWSTVAPTGTVSMLTQTSSGIEPVFKPYYTRRRKINPSNKDAKADFIDDNGDKFEEFLVVHHELKKWMTLAGYKDFDQETVDRAFPLSPWFGNTANDIDWDMRIRMQGVVQKYTTHSISSTVNLPEDVSRDVIDSIYKSAWENNLKGITVYRDNCRTGILVNKSDSGSDFEALDAVRRPKVLGADVYPVSVKGEKFTFFVGLYKEKPYEIFGYNSGENALKKSSSGAIIKKARGEYEYEGDGDTHRIITDRMTDQQKTITRLVSLALRHRADNKHIVTQLNKDDGDMFSFEKGIARVLKKYIPDGASTSSKCQECGGEIKFQEGCETCVSCGWSKC